MNKVGVVGLLLLSSSFLAACGTGIAPRNDAVQSPGAWSQAELENVLDLSELGKPSITADGVALVGGKSLPAGVGLSNLSYGGPFNYLKLSNEALNALPTAARDFFLDASPEELREVLNQIGVTIPEIRKQLDASATGSLSWKTFNKLIYSVATRANKTNLFTAALLTKERQTLTPLATYSITPRTVVNSFIFDCGPSSGGYRINGTSTTTSNLKSYYLAAKNTLTIMGTVRGDTNTTEKFGPISSVVDTVRYSHPCQNPGATTKSSGWHKGKYTSSSAAIIKTSSW